MTASASPHPFSDTLWGEIQQLVGRLDDRQAMWLSGYLAARGQTERPGAGVAAPTGQTAGGRILIAFGGETGNSESLARRLAERAGERGFSVEVADLANIRVRQLAKREYVLIVCSTHGDGDPPEPVHAFYDALMDDTAPRMPGLRYAVLALGDSSYDQFCVTGQQLDARLAALDAQRLVERRDCDVDYEAPAGEWMEAVLGALPSNTAGSASRAGVADAVPLAAASAQGYSKQQPLTVELLENVCLSAPTRHSPVHHLEVAMEAPAFQVSPGDAVGVLADNPPELVAAILDATHLSGEQPVTMAGEAMPLVQALRERCDLTVPGKRFLEGWAELTGSPALAQQVAADTKAQRQFLRSHQIRDLVTGYHGRPDPQWLVDNLRPLQPRLYDIANSLASTPDELHLTVKHYHYPFGGREEIGIASDYLLQLRPGDQLRIYPHRNVRFQLPADPAVPLILIADGTGIAPYRAFAQEIAASGRGNRCWLVFSEQCFEDDFLYQLDWQKAHQSGLVERVDTVFYGDHPERTLGGALAAAETQLLDWLRAGAHLYLCGDKDRLTQCERELGALVDRTAGEELNWKQLDKAKRIHRNLY